ncbi:MAG: hypothetical protein MJ072_04350 [Clostridia bacterium]|nr:hypothetical protein [Clostridia bacterium]
MNKEFLRSLYVELCDCPTLARKKEIASLVGIDSKKADEIKIAVSEKLRELRNSATEFDNDDVRDFSRLFKDGIPSTERHLFPTLSKEPFSFVRFLVNHYETKLVEKNLLKYVSYAKIKYSRFSGSDRYIMGVFNSLVKFFNENDPSTEVERVSKENDLVELTEKFRVLLADFKVFYLDIIQKRAVEIFMNNVAILPKLKANAEKAEQDYNDKRDYVTWDERSKLFNDYRNARDAYNKCLTFIKRYGTTEGYVKSELAEGERDFENNLRVIAEKVNEFNLDISKVTVSNVGLDPKIFEMVVSDGNTNLYCRSIFTYGAVLVRPHFRFIITKR